VNAIFDRESADGFLTKKFVTTVYASSRYASGAAPFEVRELDAALRVTVQSILNNSWSGPMIAVNGRLWDSQTMKGLAAVSKDGSVLGYLLYEFHDSVCEIMVLESVARNIGVASALIAEVKKFAKSGGADKVTVQTSNDNSYAFRFYQRRGFTIRDVRLGALDEARRLKSAIPLIGEDGIPLRDEIEFEI
jgi:ribosomal protein S18 acetylase RimI-like enzyme